LLLGSQWGLELMLLLYQLDVLFSGQWLGGLYW
jgi:hypothetical protein